MAKPVFIDTDPGMDDAVAILAALGMPDILDVRMITTVGGNVPLSMTTSNALLLCEIAARIDIPVHGGCLKPLIQHANAVFHVHGESGLGRLSLSPPKKHPEETHAVPAMVEALRQASRPVTIAALAPLTNIALALTIAPDIIDKIDEIVVMGGSFSGGNITPFASYNIHSDPHAAHMVLNSGASIRMAGLEVTRELKPDQNWLEALADEHAVPARFVAELWQGATLCFNDAAVILAISYPQLFQSEEANVAVNLVDSERIGETTKESGEPNALVLTSVNRTEAFQVLRRALVRTLIDGSA